MIENHCIIHYFFIYLLLSASGPNKPTFLLYGDRKMQRKDDIQELVVPILERMGIELVDIQLHGSGNRTILRIFVDEPGGGIQLSRCIAASREISDILDRKDAIASRYILEVSSPGLDRPLKTEKDFKRNIGEKAVVTVKDEQGMKQLEGIIHKVDGGVVGMDCHERYVEFKLDQITTAKLAIELK
jgi:ribosome maturation factor RimP